MSSLPPPPPDSPQPYQQPSTPPVPPPPPAGWNNSSPPGYTPPGYTGAGIRPSKGLSKAMIILYWCVTAGMLLTGIGVWRKHSVAEDALNGNATISEVNDTNALIAAGLLLTIVTAIAAAILTAIWSHRVVSNAKARGVVNVSPGLAAGGWFIPIGSWFVQWIQLRRAARALGIRTTNVSWWQGLFIAQGIAVRVTGEGSEDRFLDRDYLDTLQQVFVFALIATVVYAISAWMAKQAADDLDEGITRL